jgi:hypothetical protein
MNTRIEGRMVVGRGVERTRSCRFCGHRYQTFALVLGEGYRHAVKGYADYIEAVEGALLELKKHEKSSAGQP